MASKYGGIPVEEEQPKSKYGGVPVDESPPLSFMGTLQEMGTQGKDFLTGVGKGALSTGMNALNFGAQLHNMAMPSWVAPAIPPPVSQETISKWTTPQGTAQQVGKGAEQFGEFFIPSPTKLVGASKLAKAGMEGLKTGLVTGAQTGDVGAAATAGGLGFGISGTMQNIPGAYNYLKGAAKDAIEWAESKGIPMTFGQRTGNVALSRAEQGLQNVMGASGPALRQARTQEEAIEKIGPDLINRYAPGQNLNEFETGQNVAARVQQIITSAKAQADKLYDDVRTMYEKGKKVVQTGTKASPIIDPATGQAIQVPVTKTFETPVDVAAAKTKLKPIYDELSQTMPEAKRQYSPGYAALKQLMEGPDIVDAVVADRNLSALKSILRKSGNPYLNSQSQGIAWATVQDLSQAFNRGLNAVNPNILPTLQKARDAVTAQHTAAEILNDLPSEPAQLYGLLSRPGDRTVEAIKELKKLAPTQVQQVARTYLQGMWDKLTEGGEMKRAAGAFRDWQKMGPETKKLIFGGNTQELDKFFLAVKRLRLDYNPSGTAAMALASIGPVGAAIHTFFTPGTMEDKLKRGAIEIPAAFMWGNMLSRLLVTPGGAKALTTVLNSPSQSQPFRNAVSGVASMVSRMFTAPEAAPVPPPPGTP